MESPGCHTVKDCLYTNDSVELRRRVAGIHLTWIYLAPVIGVKTTPCKTTWTQMFASGHMINRFISRVFFPASWDHAIYNTVDAQVFWMNIEWKSIGHNHIVSFACCSCKSFLYVCPLVVIFIFNLLDRNLTNRLFQAVRP